MEGEQGGTFREPDAHEPAASAVEGGSAGSSGQQEAGKRRGSTAQESLVSDWAII